MSLAPKERYETRACVGTDADGRTFIGWDRFLNREVCLRIVNEPGQDRIAFARGIAIAGSGQHALPRVFAVEPWSDDRALIVMEALRGVALGDALFGDARRRFEDISTWILSLAQSLRLLHRNGYVFLRLESNRLCVITDAEGTRHVKISGLSALRAERSASGSLEQLRPAGAPLASLDVYALAKIAHELIEELGSDQTTKDFLKEYAPGAPCFFSIALDPVPENRFPDVDTFIDAWHSLRTDLSIRPHSVHDDVHIGEIVGKHYELRALVGRGARGTVYLGYDRSLLRTVAVKVLSRVGGAADPLMLEARHLARIRDPHVTRVFAAGLHKDRPYVVTEYVTGEPLDQLIDAKQLNDEDSLSALRQVCRGLEAIHTAGLVHSDLRPKSVLVGPGFQVQISDLSFAATPRSLAEQGAIPPESAAYTAPERLLGTLLEELAPRVDLFALGILGFQLFAHRLPFEGETERELLRENMSGSFVPLKRYRPDLSSQLCSLIDRLRAKDPTARPASAAEVRRSLDMLATQSLPPARQSVFIVDDDDDFRALVRLHVEHHWPNAEVHEASSAADVRQLVVQHSPDVVLLDLALEGNDTGMDVVRFLRSSTSLTPAIIVLTGTGCAADWAVVQALGGEAFLFKPLEPQALRLALDRIVRKRGLSLPPGGTSLPPRGHAS